MTPLDLRAQSALIRSKAFTAKDAEALVEHARALTAENRRLTSERDIACQRVARVEVARCAAVAALEAVG